VASFLQDDLAKTCIQSISQHLSVCCLEIAQDPTGVQQNVAFNQLIGSLLTLDEELLVSILSSVNLKLFLPNAPKKLVQAALLATVSNQELSLDSALSCIPSTHRNVLSCLTNFRKLKRLSLASNFLTDESFDAIVPNLVAMRALQHLNVCGNYLTHKSAAVLAPALAGLPFLEHVDISSNAIADRGACALSQHLPSIPSLSFLNIKNNSVTSTGFAALSAAMQQLASLKCLDISENSLSQLLSSSASLDEHLQV
jgi:Leucine Rich repeat